MRNKFIGFTQLLAVAVTSFLIPVIGSSSSVATTPTFSFQDALGDCDATFDISRVEVTDFDANDYSLPGYSLAGGPEPELPSASDLYVNVNFVKPIQPAFFDNRELRLSIDSDADRLSDFRVTASEFPDEVGQEHYWMGFRHWRNSDRDSLDFPYYWRLSPDSKTISFRITRFGELPESFGVKVSLRDFNLQEDVDVAPDEINEDWVETFEEVTNPVYLDPVSGGSETKVSGKPISGEYLSASSGGWAAGTSISWTWYLNGQSLPNSNGPKIRVLGDWVGKSLKAVATANRLGYRPKHLASKPVAIQFRKFSKTPTPRILGVSKQGSTLTVATGTWDSGTRLTIQWKVNGRVVPGAVKNRFILRAVDAGKKVSVSVSGSKTGYHTTTRSSLSLTVKTK